MIFLAQYYSLLFQLTIQLALCGFAEFVLHLTRMNPDMMYLHQDSGFLNIAYYKFDIDDTTGESLSNKGTSELLLSNGLMIQSQYDKMFCKELLSCKKVICICESRCPE